MPRKLTSLAIVGLIAASCPAQAFDFTAGSSFYTEFSTHVDYTRWMLSHGWANGPHQNCTWNKTNARGTDTGIELLLTAERTRDRDYRCAELQSHGFYGYGTYEVGMRPVKADGLVTAFFTFTGEPHEAGRPHTEIDFEFLGKDTTQVFLNYFAGGGAQLAKDTPLGFDASQGVTDYAFVWEPTGITWYAKGRVIQHIPRTEGVPFPTLPSKIYLSIWNGTGWDQEAWLGRFVSPPEPLAAAVNYVAYTALGDPCQFPTSLVCKIRP